MDIKVGNIAPTGGTGDRARNQPQGTIEARLLALRTPRRRNRQGHPARDRDPVNGRVLVLMVPDGTQLPADLDGGAWRVFLRFARR